MTVLEQRFIETVPDALRRIAAALEGINAKLELLSQHGDPVKEQEQAPEDGDIAYDDIEKSFLGRVRLTNWPIKRTLINALYYRPECVSKTCASNLSQLYSGVTVEQTEAAIASGEISGVIPEMRDVTVTRYDWQARCNNTVQEKRPAGKYQVSLRSAIQWLEQHGRLCVGHGHVIYDCIQKIKTM